MIVYSTASSAPYEFGTTARYSCSTGYGLTGGDVMLSCEGDGLWNGAIPTCEGDTDIIDCLQTSLIASLSC